MAHRIGRHEPIDAALHRLVHEDIAKARIELTGSGSAEQRIHRVRQRLKRARSLLGVVEPRLGDRAREARRALAGAGRLLAGARDADAAAASARELRAAARDSDDAGLDRVVAELDSKALEAHQRAAPVNEVRQRLAIVEADFGFFPDQLDGVVLLAAALRRSYRRGRQAMRRAETSLATPDLHRWRKAVKDLWHLLVLARKRLPRQMRPAVERLKRLSEVLGQDHDHAVLAERLALSPTGHPALMRQLALIARERQRLESEAFALGAAIYRRKPERFAKRTRIR